MSFPRTGGASQRLSLVYQMSTDSLWQSPLSPTYSKSEYDGLMIGKLDAEELRAALIGYQHQQSLIELKIADIRRRLGERVETSSTKSAPAAAPAGRRKMSASARRRIAAAQKKRWAAFHAGQGPAKKAAAAPAAAKRKHKISAAGRRAIAEATRKRWAEFRAKKTAA